MTGWLGAAGVALRETVSDLAALVLPVTCPGCGRDASPPSARFCPACAGVLSAAVPGPVSPSPVPAGMPPCAALAPYDGVLREAILAYKERGRHDLARPLGGLLAAVVLAGSDRAAPLVLVPVPATASAARERFGDHMARLAGHAVRTLRTAGWSAVVSRPLRARPRPDSATLDTAGRARAAADASRVRAGAAPALRRAAAAGVHVVVVYDIVTTGATLAAVARVLATAGVPVARAAVLAATQRRLTAGQSGELFQ